MSTYNMSMHSLSAVFYTNKNDIGSILLHSASGHSFFLVRSSHTYTTYLHWSESCNAYFSLFDAPRKPGKCCTTRNRSNHILRTVESISISYVRILANTSCIRTHTHWLSSLSKLLSERFTRSKAILVGIYFIFEACACAQVFDFPHCY